MVKLLNKKKSKKDPELFSYQAKDGEKLWGFRHRYYNVNGERKEKTRHGFKEEKTAFRELMRAKSETASGIHNLSEKDNMTVSEWLDRWYQANEYKWKISTKTQRKQFIDKWFHPYIGHFKLQNLDASTYQQNFIRPLKSKLKESSISNLHRIINVAINSAVEDEILPKNKISRVQIKDPNAFEDKPLRYYTPEQLELFLETAKNTMPTTPYVLLKILAYSGMRKGEALGLTWNRVNLIENTITIAQTRDDFGVRPPKTKNSWRLVYMDQEVMKDLKSYKHYCKQLYLSKGKKWNDDELVFISSRDATPYGSTAVTYAMKKIVEKAALPKLRVHDLRHTHATILMLNPNITPHAIAERLGNTVDMINKVYGHVLEKTNYEAMLAFSDVLSNQKKVFESNSGESTGETKGG